ncbi:hypothetical protein [Pseudoduganella sp.]|uniref:hypothetical protein n=1 Tax=Pseudoduganella sp. TaxID=1880898 RepID=UPI0035B38FC8
MSARPQDWALGDADAMRGLGWLRWAPALLVALAVACGAAACFLYTLNHDVAYLLYAAGRVLRGATLYVDVPEINPPLIVWLKLPLAWLALHTGWPDALVLRLAVLAAGMLAVAWSAHLLRAQLAGGFWWSWTAVGVFVALLLPGYEFGQREHLALLCGLPYLAEAALRCNRQPASRSTQVAAAVLATIGFALKPHFFAVPLLVEVYAAWRLRRLSMGCVAAVALLAAYLAAIWLFAPHYLDMVRLLATGYWGFSKGWGAFLTVPYFYATALLVLLASLARPRAGELPAVLRLAIAGFTLAAIVQQKGWSYHWIGALSLAWLLFGLAAASATAHRSVRGMPLTPVIVAGVMALLSLFALFTARVEGRKINPHPDTLGPVIRELGGGPVIIFSSFQVSFPLVTEAGIGSSSRFPTMTIVQAMERGGNREAVAWIRRAFAQDYYRAPPRLLIQETGPDGRPVIDFVSYFNRDVPELQQYRLVRRTPRFMVLAAPAAGAR